MTKQLLIMCLVASLFGCNTNPVKVLEDENGLKIVLSKKSDDVYTLVNKRGLVYSKSNGKNGTLKFDIPKYTDADQCCFVLDNKGKLFLNKSVKLSIFHDYRLLLSKKSKAEIDLQVNIGNQKDHLRRLNQTKSYINNHRAFNGESCTLLPSRAVPNEPDLPCRYESECQEDAAAICYTKHIGVFGCNIALKELGASSILTSPFCAQSAAKLANEKYNMDDFVVDLLWGFADEVGDRYIDSKLWDEKALGAFIILTSTAFKVKAANDCISDFVKKYYEPRRAWLKIKNKIQNEPIKIKNQCISLINQYNYSLDGISEYRKKNKVLEQNVKNLKKQIQEEKARSYKAVFCQ